MADTNVIVNLTKSSPLSQQYEALRNGRLIAISFQVRAELAGYPDTQGWGGARQQRLAELVAACVQGPQTDASITWYARVAQRRMELRLQQVSDGDVWVIAQALEHSAPLMTHDRAAGQLAQTMGVKVLTTLEL
ncbi:MAG TPA: PIN domain-containing protein [Tepidiformaceae bacterium]|nr:PIN domain-containing protein [Tepidiformaceae bacterium]